VPLRHVAGARQALANAERVRQLGASVGEDDAKTQQFCSTIAAATDLRPLSPFFERLLKESTAGMEKHLTERGMPRCLAMMEFARGDYERAVTHYEADGALQDSDTLVDELAWARVLAGDAKGAMETSQRYVAARKQAGKLDAYDLASALALYARAKAEAPAELRALATQFTDGPWPRPVLAYQLGTLNEADLLALAGKQSADRRDRMLSDAWFYIAQQRYARNDKPGGAAALMQVSMHGIFGTPQLHQALGELWYADYGDKDYRNGKLAFDSGDKARALELYQLAGQRGHGAALRAMGYMYRTGNGVSKDTARAIELFRSAAANGDTNAMNTLGAMASDGEGMAPDQAAAVAWFMKAATVGDYYASRNMGWRHRRGTDVVKDGALARQFLTDAAELGNGDAQGELADVYLNGEDVPVDYMLANYWARRAIESYNQHGKAILGYLYAYGYGLKADLPRAIKLWQDAADTDEMAQFQLGLAYFNGRGVEKDLRKARNLWGTAASTGNLYARLYLDHLLMNDSPSAKEAQRVISSFTGFAADGVTEAAEFLSQYYLNGIGVAKDPAAGAHWAQVAAGKSKATPEIK
jgi:TPR repeat protein